MDVATRKGSLKYAESQIEPDGYHPTVTARQISALAASLQGFDGNGIYRLNLRKLHCSQARRENLIKSWPASVHLGLVRP